MKEVFEIVVRTKGKIFTNENGKKQGMLVRGGRIMKGAFGPFCAAHVRAVDNRSVDTFGARCLVTAYLPDEAAKLMWEQLEVGNHLQFEGKGRFAPRSDEREYDDGENAYPDVNFISTDWKVIDPKTGEVLLEVEPDAEGVKDPYAGVDCLGADYFPKKSGYVSLADRLNRLGLKKEAMEEAIAEEVAANATEPVRRAKSKLL